MGMLRRGWPKVRAVLILVAFIVGLADGCPMPPHEQTRKYSPTLAPTLLAIDGVRTKLLAPFRPLAELMQISQRWSLFRGASQSRYRMRVEGKTLTGAWETVFRAGDDELERYADTLHYRRMRGVWNPSGDRLRGGYDRFCYWMNTRVLADHPQFELSRVVLERIDIGDGGGYTPTGVLVHERLRRRRAK